MSRTVSCGWHLCKALNRIYAIPLRVVCVLVLVIQSSLLDYYLIKYTDIVWFLWFGFCGHCLIPLLLHYLLHHVCFLTGRFNKLYHLTFICYLFVGYQ